MFQEHELFEFLNYTVQQNFNFHIGDIPLANGFTRLYKAIWYTQVGRVLEQTDRHIENVVVSDQTEDDILADIHSDFQLYEKPVEPKETLGVIRGAYEDILQDKRDNIQRYKQVIGQLIALVEQKKNSLSKLTGEIDNLEEMKAGAIAKTKSTAAALQKAGSPDEEIKQDPDYVRCVSSYNDFHSTLEEKNARVEKLQQDIERAQRDIEEHKNRITFLHRDLHKIETEQSEAIADFTAAREQDEINNMLSEIRDDSNTKDE